MNVPALLVNNLRKKTGVGIMECKKALLATACDFSAALELLRSRGFSLAAKKEGRTTTNGLTALNVKDKDAVIIEINSETDFVSRNEKFQALTKKIIQQAINYPNIEQLKASTIENNETIESLIVDSIMTIGENINLRRMQKIRVTEGVIASYVHNTVTETENDMGKVSVLVALESSGSKDKLMNLGKQIAMHVAALKPLYLNKELVDLNLIEREKSIFSNQSKNLGKTDNIREKIVNSKLKKFLDELVLMDQPFIMDSKLTVSDVITNFAKEMGVPVALKEYVRYEVGEEIQ